MKIITYIENKTSQDLEFLDTDFILISNEKTILTGFTSELSLFSLKDSYDNSLIDFYDQDDILMLSQEVYESWRKIFNSIKYKDENFKIYNFLNNHALKKYDDYSITPKSIDYKKDLTINLQEKQTFNKGFLIKSEFFENVTLISNSEYEYENPIMMIENEYVIDSDKYLYYKTEKISWQLENGIYSTDTKITTKYYDRINAILEGKVRRNNIINGLIRDVVNFIVLTNITQIEIFNAEEIGLPLLDINEINIDKFMKGNIQPLIDSITNDTDNEFLDNEIVSLENITIRQYILSVLNSSILEVESVIF